MCAHGWSSRHFKLGYTTVLCAAAHNSKVMLHPTMTVLLQMRPRLSCTKQLILFCVGARSWTTWWISLMT